MKKTGDFFITEEKRRHQKSDRENESKLKTEAKLLMQ